MANAVASIDAVEVVNVLQRINERAHDVDLGEVGQQVVTAVQDKLDAEGEVGVYPRWPELSDTTLRRRPGAKMLQATGQLAGVQATPEGAMTVVVRSPAPYAGFHVTGTVRMPRRDFFELDYDAVLEQVGLRILEHAAEV